MLSGLSPIGGAGFSMWAVLFALATAVCIVLAGYPWWRPSCVVCCCIGPPHQQQGWSRQGRAASIFGQLLLYRCHLFLLRIPANVTGHSGDRDRFAHGLHAGTGFVL